MVSTISVPKEALLECVQVLEALGFQVNTPPPMLLALGQLLTAWSPARGEGFLLSAPECRLLAYYKSLEVLDPGWGDSRPRWERESERRREVKYLEAALANAITEMQSTGEGSRNQTLNRLAYGLARLEHLGLDRELVMQGLLEAALLVGLPEHEAQSTFRAAWERGIREPRDLPLGSPPTPKAASQHLLKLKCKWRPRG